MMCRCMLSSSGVLIHGSTRWMCVMMMMRLCVPPPRPSSVRSCWDIMVRVVESTRQWDGCVWRWGCYRNFCRFSTVTILSNFFTIIFEIFFQHMCTRDTHSTELFFIIYAVCLKLIIFLCRQNIFIYFFCVVVVNFFFRQLFIHTQFFCAFITICWFFFVTHNEMREIYLFFHRIFQSIERFFFIPFDMI